MNYKIYTFPNCNSCQDVKNILKEKNIEYKEINVGLGDGRKNFSEFYNKNKGIIKRDNNGQILLPILEGEKGIYQGLEKIIKISDKL